MSARNLRPLPSGCAITTDSFFAFFVGGIGAAVEGNPLAVRRPLLIAVVFLSATETNRMAGAHVHHPDLAVRPSVAIVVLHHISEVCAIRGEFRRKGGTQMIEVVSSRGPVFVKVRNKQVPGRRRSKDANRSFIGVFSIQET